MIVSDDKNGVGKITGKFVYVQLDEYGDIDCGLSLVSGQDYGDSFLSEARLIESVDGKAEFDYWSRNPLDDSSEGKVYILSKSDIAKMIKSLQKIYDEM